MNTKTTWAAALLLACAAGAAQAQAVYRCGNSYSQTPCAGAAPVPAGDARSAAQAKDSAAATRRDAKLAAAMEKERLAREKKEAASRAPLVIGEPKSTAAPAPQAAASAGRKKGGKQPEHFTAVGPKPAADKKKPKGGKKS